MPWTAQDADSHTQSADDPKLKQMWAEIADKELASGKDDGTAVKIANGVVAKQAAKKSVKKSAAEKLVDIAKSFGNELVSSTKVDVRQHKRKFLARKNANWVRPHMKRRFKDSSQMRGISNVQDV